MVSSWIGWSLGNGLWFADWGLITLPVAMEDIEVDGITRENMENEKSAGEEIHIHRLELLRQPSVLLFYPRVFLDPFVLWIKYSPCSFTQNGHWRLKGKLLLRHVTVQLPPERKLSAGAVGALGSSVILGTTVHRLGVA